jgi:5-methylcytosine-specific restriction protein A
MARSIHDKLYQTQRWRKRSLAHRRAHPFCVMCEAEGKVSLATQVHHVVEHHGDEVAFFLGEVIGLCLDHHNLEHKRNPSRGYSPEIGVDGWPIDPGHIVYRYEGKHR